MRLRLRSSKSRSGGITLAHLVLTLLLLTIVAAPAAAQDEQRELGGKFRSGDEVVVLRDEIVEGDLYAFAGAVRIEGTVRGDVVAFGGDVDVSGVVEGDVLAAGGQIDVSGEVGGDLRASGGQVRLAGSVGEDMMASGGRVTLGSRASAAQDLVFAAGAMTLSGDVGGSVLGATGSYSNTGDVAGTERITNWGAEDDEPTAGERVAGFLRQYLAVLVIGAVLLLLVRRSMQGAREALERRVGWSALAGLLFLVGVVAGLVVLFVLGTLLALGLGWAEFGSLLLVVILIMVGAALAAVVVLLVLAAWVAPAVVAVWLGSLALRSRAGSDWWPFAALALGALVILLLFLIPYLGPVVRLAVFFLGTGALVLHRGGWWGRGPAPADDSQEPLPV